MSEWISVDERLPKEDEDVLCYCCDDSYIPEIRWIEVMSHHNSFFTDVYHELVLVTHWQPLPEPPTN